MKHLYKFPAKNRHLGFEQSLKKKTTKKKTTKQSLTKKTTKKMTTKQSLKKKTRKKKTTKQSLTKKTRKKKTKKKTKKKKTRRKKKKTTPTATSKCFISLRILMMNQALTPTPMLNATTSAFV